MKKFTAKLFSALLMLSIILTPAFLVLRPTPVQALPADDDLTGEYDNSPDRGETTTPSNPSDSSLNQVTNPGTPGTLDTPTPENKDNDQNPDQNSQNKDTSKDESKDKNKDKDDQSDDGEEERPNVCNEKSGALAWFICPFINFLGSTIDDGINLISNLFDIDPLSTSSDSPVYLVWEYVRNLTNIVFVIFILIVIYSQLTGLGINNYGIKRVLPRIIIAIILVNLSFIICNLLIDISNILGSSLRDTFTAIEKPILAQVEDPLPTYSDLVGVFIGGAGIALIANFTGGIGALLFMLLPIIISGAISVLIGIVTIACRQAVVALLVMIAPLAFVAYLLPNTEKWFIRWRDLLFRMLVFYPMFSFLYGASSLLGDTLIMAAKDPFSLIIGFGVKVIPLFFAFSLMKMSGTVLGSLNGALARLAAPVNTTAAGWAGSHAERRRQHTIANSRMPGARLRRYLDYKKNLREADTDSSVRARKSLAATRTYNRMASYNGRRADGTDNWRKRANRYTENAKHASLAETRTATAKEALDNTLNQYGDHFGTAAKNPVLGRPTISATRAAQKATKLSNAHAEAFKDNMAQKFLTVNNAQADQEFLLGEYMKAANKRFDPEGKKEFNRLIGNAVGGLGHLGEGSIMGQVISENVRIEQRRRQEARVIATKFGYKKSNFRGMTFDCEYINDDGYETDENGEPLHDAQLKYADGEYGNRSKYHRPWKQFIGIHKVTRKEITADEYNALSESERTNYNRVNFMDIVNDRGEPVQRVYADDAGYMKELLRDDIAIGDPINRRYITSIGKKMTDEELAEFEKKYHVHIPKNSKVFINEDGPLRRYHSVISNSLLETKYKEHDASITPMLTAQGNNGALLTMGQYNIANIDSIVKAAKAGPILQNDRFAIESWTKYIRSLYSDKKGERFEDLFPDDLVAMYGNVNSTPLKGYRATFDDNGQFLKWESVKRTDPTITLEERKNFLKHAMFTDLAKKLVSSVNRRLSPNILDSQKPETLRALLDLIDTLKEASFRNLDPNIDYNDKLDPSVNIFDSPNPDILQYNVRNIQAALYRAESGEDLNSVQQDLEQALSNNGISNKRSSNQTSNNRSSNNQSSGQTHQQSTKSSPKRSNQRSGYNLFTDAIARAKDREAQEADYLEPQNIIETIDNICNDFNGSYELAAERLLDYFTSNTILSRHLDELETAIQTYREDRPTSAEDGIKKATNFYAADSDRIHNLHVAALEIAQRALYTD